MKLKVLFLFDVLSPSGSVLLEAVRLREARMYAKTWNAIVHGRNDRVSIRKAWRCERLFTCDDRRTGKKPA